MNKKKKKRTINQNPPTKLEPNESRNAKLILFIFGVGPILAMTIYLFRIGFFN
tara:strand:- start:572 stop:730 length:159 start_codon:yes stop_codon:yes gene_type:complete